MREWESSHHPWSENRFSALSRNKFFTPERSGDAGDDGEGGTNRESATALLVTVAGGTSDKMTVSCMFCVLQPGLGAHGGSGSKVHIRIPPQIATHHIHEFRLIFNGLACLLRSFCGAK